MTDSHRALRDRIAEVLSDHFDPDCVTGVEFQEAADAVLVALGLEQVGWAEQWPFTGIYRLDIPPLVAKSCVPIYRLAASGRSDNR